MAEIPLDTLRDLAARVWTRHEPDQVILREDIAWLRRQCPELRILLTSASPQPVLEVAGERLGVDDVVYSSVEESGGWLSAPPWRAGVSRPAKTPRRICPPGSLRVNAGHAKIDEMARRVPEALERAADTVGISDTGYGEDFCWTAHFGRVIDVNSPTPFSPVTEARSPLTAVHSATLLTRAERDARRSGDARFDARRREVSRHEPVRFQRSVLSSVLAEEVGRVDELLAAADQARRACRAQKESEEASLLALEAERAAAVSDYNTACEPARGVALARIGAIEREESRTRHRLAAALRPMSAVARALADELALARTKVEELALAEEGRPTSSGAGGRHFAHAV